MNEQEIHAYLLEHAVVWDEAALEVLTGFNGIGRFHARYGRLAPDGDEYVLKWPSHESAEHQLQLELIVSRIGRLFNPPLTPAVRVAVVTEAQAAGVQCDGVDVETGEACTKPIGGGRVFASNRLEYCCKDQLPGASDMVNIARTVAFDVWLSSEDSEFVLDTDLQPYTIDHEDSLRGAVEWLEGSEPDVIFLPRPRHNHEQLKDPKLYQSFLRELADLTDQAIVHCFSGIPTNFLGTTEQRAHLAAYALARRPGVGGAVDAYCDSQ